MQPKILFRADGGSTIGLGHISRCLALMEMLQDDFDCTFAIHEPDDSVLDFIKPVCKNIIVLKGTAEITAETFAAELSKFDVVVLDGYNFTLPFQQKIKATNKLVYIDDLCQWRMVADVVINHSDAVSSINYEKEDYTKLYLGSQYALLRSPFLKAALAERKMNAIENVIISMGGADADNYGFKALKAIEAISQIKKINAIVGSVNKNREQLNAYTAGKEKITLHSQLPPAEYCELLKTCQLIICPASTTVIEACAVGLIICTGYSADNQLNILSGLDKRGAVYNLGSFAGSTETAITNAILKILEDKTNWQRQLAAQRTIIDGQSITRIKEIFKLLYAEVPVR